MVSRQLHGVELSAGRGDRAALDAQPHRPVGARKYLIGAEVDDRAVRPRENQLVAVDHQRTLGIAGEDASFRWRVADHRDGCGLAADQHELVVGDSHVPTVDRAQRSRFERTGTRWKRCRARRFLVQGLLAVEDPDLGVARSVTRHDDRADRPYDDDRDRDHQPPGPAPRGRFLVGIRRRGPADRLGVVGQEIDDIENIVAAVGIGRTSPSHR